MLTNKEKKELGGLERKKKEGKELNTDEMVRLAALQEKEAKVDEPPNKPPVKEQEKETKEPNQVDQLKADGYKHLGSNGHADFFNGPDKKAFMLGKNGILRCVGNTFGDRMLKGLKK